MRNFGAHVTSSGGPSNTMAIAESAGINTVMIMPTAPMRWITKDIPEDNAKVWVEAQMKSGVKKVLMHGIYLINLARGDSQMFHLSKLSVLSYVNFASDLMKYCKDLGSDLDVIGMCFHPGSAKDLSVEDGIKRISQGLNWIIKESRGEGMILLESSAGAGNVLGDKLEELAAMRDGVEKKERVGYVLDTQHMFVSGYDWTTNIDNIVLEIDKVLGLENVKAFHLNDSKMEMGSHKDRHENIGEGKIGKESIKNIINHPKLKNIPFILETPNLKDVDTFKEECRKVMEWGID